MQAKAPNAASKFAKENPLLYRILTIRDVALLYLTFCVTFFTLHNIYWAIYVHSLPAIAQTNGYIQYIDGAYAVVLLTLLSRHEWRERYRANLYLFGVMYWTLTVQYNVGYLTGRSLISRFGLAAVFYYYYVRAKHSALIEDGGTYGDTLDSSRARGSGLATSVSAGVRQDHDGEAPNTSGS